MTRRKAYCWTFAGKWYASPVTAGDPRGYRPSNEYASRALLEGDLARRRMEPIWEWDGGDTKA